MEPSPADPPPPSASAARATAFAVVALLGASLLLAFTFPAWTVDDAFITYRHAENLALHGDLNWNAGEDPVEGCTGIALPLAVAAGFRLGLDPDVVTDAIGAASLILSALFLWLAVRAAASAADPIASFDPIAALAVLLLLVAPPSAIHWGSGLETTLFSATLIGAAALALEAVRGETRDPPGDPSGASPGASSRRRVVLELALAPALLLLGLVRPEGAAVGAILAAGVGVVRLREGRRATFGWLARASLGFAIPGAIYFAWRWNHYGAPLPNTFYAKRASEGIDADAARQLASFLYDSLAAPAAGVALALLVSRGSSTARPARLPTLPSSDPVDSRGVRVLLVAISFAILLPFLQYLRSRPVMAYAYRFHAPFLPLAYLLFAVAARASWSRLRAAGPLGRGRRAVLVAGLVALAATQLGLALGGHRELRLHARSYRCVLEDEHFLVGDLLREIVPPGESIVVYMDVGAIGFRSKLPIVDFGALNDETLARGGLSDSEKIDHFFARRPAAAVFTSRAPDRVQYAFEGADVPPASAILADPRFAEYRLARVFRTDRAPRPQRYFQFVFVRADLESRVPPASAPESAPVTESEEDPPA